MRISVSEKSSYRITGFIFVTSNKEYLRETHGGHTGTSSAHEGIIALPSGSTNMSIMSGINFSKF